MKKSQLKGLFFFFALGVCWIGFGWCSSSSDTFYFNTSITTFNTHPRLQLFPHHWELQCKIGLIYILSKTKTSTRFVLSKACLCPRAAFNFPPWRHRLCSAKQSHIKHDFCRPAFSSRLCHPAPPLARASDKAAFLWPRPPSPGEPRHSARRLSHRRFSSSRLVAQNDVEATKAAPALNSAKADPSAAPAPVSASLDDAELKKAQEKCKRQQTEISKLAEENRQLKVR